MAQGEATLTGDSVQGNWATEETMTALLDVMENAYGRKGKGGGDTDKQQKKHNEAVEHSSKLFRNLNQRIEDAKSAIKDRIKSERELAEKSTPQLVEAFDVMKDSGRMAGKGIKNLGSSAAGAVEEFEKMEDTAKGVSDTFFKVVGGAGAIGTAFGVAAGVLDEFIEFQTGAIQRGFSFSGALVDTRTEVAEVGLRMRQLGDVIAMNGEALRFLGSNGRDATSTFIGMIDSYREQTRQFGFFGATTEEMAGQLIEQVDILRRGGMQENLVRAQAVDSLKMLNEETYALSRLTGVERREIMRNNLEMQESNALLLHNLGNLGPEAMAGYNSMMQTLTGSLGGDSPVIEMINNMLRTYFADGQIKLTPDEIAAMNMVPGLQAALQDLVDDFTARSGAVTQDLQFADIRGIAEILGRQNDQIADQVEILGEEDGMGAILLGLLQSEQNARNILSRTLDEAERILAEDISDSEAEMLMLRDRIRVVQQEIMASFLRLFQLDDLEDLANDETFEAVRANVAAFGDGLESISNGIERLASIFGDGDGTIVDEMLVGAGLIFAAKGAVALALAAGAASMWSTVMGTGAAATAGGAGATTGAGGGLLSKILPGARKLPYIGAAITGAMGYFDQDYRDAGYGGLDRAALGVGEGALDLVDGFANIFNWGIKEALGVGPGWDNGSDLSQSFKDWANSDDGQWWMSFGQRGGTTQDAGGSQTFGNMNFLEQQEMRNRMADDIPGSYATLDSMRAAGSLDSETHAILTGRPLPREVQEYQNRQIELLNEQNRILKSVNENLQ